MLEVLLEQTEAALTSALKALATTVPAKQLADIAQLAGVHSETVFRDICSVFSDNRNSFQIDHESLEALMMYLYGADPADITRWRNRSALLFASLVLLWNYSKSPTAQEGETRALAILTYLAYPVSGTIRAAAQAVVCSIANKRRSDYDFPFYALSNELLRNDRLGDYDSVEKTFANLVTQLAHDTGKPVSALDLNSDPSADDVWRAVVEQARASAPCEHRAVSLNRISEWLRCPRTISN